MRNIFKTFFIITLFIFAANSVFASNLEQIIKNSPFDKSSVTAVSVKDINSGKTVFEYNQNKLLHPASALKVFTAFPAYDTLGNDYSFRTTFYIYQNSLYIKLGADPLLTSNDLKSSIKKIKSIGFGKLKNVYIDSSILDNVEWGTGWMWDDGTNPLMQKFSAYNIDNNLTNIVIFKNNGTITAKTSQNSFMSVLNDVKPGNKNNICVLRHDWISPDITCVTGSIADSAAVNVPISNMKKYFELRLFDIFKELGMNIENKTCLPAIVPENAKEICSICHSINSVMPSILKNSNNKNAETLAKVAGAVKEGTTGTLSSQLKLFYDYWNKNGVNTENILIADASGVSRNNLLTADFMTSALNKLFFLQGEDTIKNYMAQPGEGTLSNRLLNYRGQVYLKTGTLSNISSITGYVITDSGKTYSIAILVQNFLCNSNQAKLFENKIIEEIIKM